MKTTNWLSVKEIQELQTYATRDLMKDIISACGKGIHESIFRSFGILEKVKHLLEIGTPHEVILEMIDLMEETPK